MSRCSKCASDEGETGVTMSDRQVRDEVLTLFVAGHETTATGLAWTVYYLCKNPEIYAALEREVDDLGETRSVADLPRLGLALRVFQEALRLMPPVYGSVVTQGPRDVGDVELPDADERVDSPWALHHPPHLAGSELRPDRS